MIVVTVELWPKGRQSAKTILGVAVIRNDGTTSAESEGQLGSYEMILTKREPKQNEVWKMGEVRDFPRKRLGVWDLMYRGLKKIVGDRNP